MEKKEKEKKEKGKEKGEKEKKKEISAEYRNMLERQAYSIVKLNF